MYDYARKSAAEQAAYSEGLLDAIDQLNELFSVARDFDRTDTAMVLDSALVHMEMFRNRQLNAPPQ